MTNRDGQRSSMVRQGPVAAGALAVLALVSMVGIGLSGLASVGSDRWIEASYGAAPAANAATPLVHVGSAASINETAPTLVVGDEQQWLTAPRIPTEKTVATNAGGLALGDRVVVSITPKGETHALARTFEIVGIEFLTGVHADAHTGAREPQVLIAREVGSSGKPTTLRMLVTDGEPAPANKSL